MLKTALIAAGALVAAMTVSLPAQAAGPSFSFGISGSHGAFHFSSPGYRSPGYRHWHQRHVLPPRAVIQRLRQQGYRVHGVQRRGNVYLARSQQRWGQRVLITADARTGRVLSVRRIG